MERARQPRTCRDLHPVRARVDAVRAAMSLAGQSLGLDRRTLGLGSLTPRARWRVFGAKARALTGLARFGQAEMPVGRVRLTVRTTNEVGTIQSSICDVHDDVICAGVLGGKDSPVVVDVGANIGQFSAAILLFAPEAAILAVEPDPDVHARLATHLATAQGVRTACVAAGAEERRVPLQRAALPVMSTLRTDGLAGYDLVGTVEVDVVTLDELTRHLPAVDLLKVDVEGYELEVMRGAQSLLHRTRFLLVELGLGREQSRDNLDVFAAVRTACPDARIVRFGRPLGDPAAPLCQDVLLELWPA
jgi:FkbM family methyltransferase